VTDPIDTDDPVLHRALGVAANNSTWELLDARTSPDDFTPEEIDDVLARAYASTYHWARAADRTPANQARGAWLVSRVHAVLGHGELALHHAERCQSIGRMTGATDGANRFCGCLMNEWDCDTKPASFGG